MAPESDEPEPYEPPGGGDGDGDGGGGGSSSGGGGFESGDPLAGYRSILLRMRIPPAPFIALMQQAAGQNWSSDEFMWALESNPRFLKMFPGVTQLLDEGMSVPGAVAAWRRLGEEFQEAAKDMGLSKLARLNPKRIGYLIENNVDLDEFKMRLGILSWAKHSEGVREDFNQILKQRGRQALDKKGWYKFLMGRGEQALFDLYEGVVLLQELGDAGLRPKQARRLGKLITGAEGAPAFDATAVGTAIREIRSTLGTEALKEAGISTKELALGVFSEQVRGSPEVRERAAAARGLLEQLLVNREARLAESGREATSSIAGRPISELAPGG